MRGRVDFRAIEPSARNGVTRDSADAMEEVKLTYPNPQLDMGSLKQSDRLARVALGGDSPCWKHRLKRVASNPLLELLERLG